MIMFSAFCALLMLAIPHIIYVVGWLVTLFTKGHIRYAPFGWTALGLAVAVLLLLSYGYFIGRWQITTKDIEYAHSDVPQAFDGFKIVHVSDLHLSTFDDSPERLEEFVEVINNQSADLICFTGDLVTMGRKEAEPYTETLAKMKARYGVVSVLGNHDFLIYDRRLKSDKERRAAVEGLADYEVNTLGWKLLRDSSMRIEAADGSCITIVGVDNKNCINQGFRTINEGDLGKAMKGVEGFCVLLSHDPSHWDAEVVPDTDIPLTLSGHTHAAQISIFGWTPASFMFKRAYGRYEEDGQTLYVNPGLGCTAPFRIGARPEVTVIILHR